MMFPHDEGVLKFTAEDTYHPVVIQLRRRYGAENACRSISFETASNSTPHNRRCSRTYARSRDTSVDHCLLASTLHLRATLLGAVGETLAHKHVPASTSSK